MHFKKIVPHIIVVILFITASVLYFSPILQGKQIQQSDITQYIGMAKQQNDFRASEAQEPYWTDTAFGGMPTYQLGAQYPHNYIKKLDKVLRFLPRPADYVFLYFICFYVLLLVLKVDWRYATLGSFLFGFSTYYIIILGVGHNAKAHAIAYMPLVLAGIFLTFRKKYGLGFIMTALAMGLELNANHFQMTYYLLLLVLVIGAVYLVDAYKKKQLTPFFKAIGVMTAAVVLSIGLNATNLLATSEYAKESTRSKSELTINSDGSPKQQTEGLDKAYITEYSYGIGESFNLLVPRLFGGSNSEPLADDSESVQKIQSMFGLSKKEAKEFAGSLMYWSDQSYVAAPAYIGAICLFLFVVGIFLVQGKIKRWILIGGGIILALSWGKNLEWLTTLFIDYIPFYNKFRAVSSIQVMVELVVPLLAVFGLHKFITSSENEIAKKKALGYATAITGGLCILFLLLQGTALDFVSFRDNGLIESYGVEFINAIRNDRQNLMISDTLRSLIFILITAAVLFLYTKNKLKENSILVVITLLVLVDLVGVNRRYVNTENFVSARQVNQPFTASAADREILQDTSHYRVLDFTTNPFNSARASYFHKSFGGYHAAKPKRAQDIFEFYIAKNKISVVNMLNVKYIIQENKGKTVALNNPYTNGNAWFVENIEKVKTANEEILALDRLDLKKSAVIQENQAALQANYRLDSLAGIQLVSHKPNHLVYKSNNTQDGVAVFSEMYYENGWKATINGKEQPIIKVNYLLRGLEVPKGKHTIEFKFEPQVVATGSLIALGSSIILVLLVMGGLFLELKRRNIS